MSRLFTIHQREETSEFGDRDLPLVIGSGNDVHIRLPEGQPVEAYIADSRGHLFLQPAEGASPIYHNDAHITSSVWIKSGDHARIGDSTLRFHISGDRVEISLSTSREETTSPPLAPPPDSPAEQKGTEKRPGKTLPRVATEPVRPRSGNKVRYLVLGIFLLLLLAAAFVLMARSIEITVSPAPEKLTVSGFPPAFKVGSHYLALKGTYTVQASRPGYQDLEKTVTVTESGPSRFNFSMEKLPGLLDITSVPPKDVEIFIDDQRVGSTPLAGLEVPAGKHRLRLVKERCLTIEQDIEVEGLGTRQKFNFVLQPSWGKVELTSNPAGAAVFKGETELGQTPLTLELPGGKHLLTLRKKGFSPVDFNIEVTPGKILTPETITLSPAPATVFLKTSPAGAAVTVDGVFAGTTPVTLSLSPGKQHEISLKLSGHESRKSLLTLEAGASRELSFTLTPEYGIIFLTTEPANATLLVDGRPHGPATGRLRLTAAPHTLTVQARGYQTARRTVTPVKARSRQLNITLKPVGTSSRSVGSTPKKTASAAGQPLIRLGPAIFTMGASRREPGRRANEQLRQVKITRPFYLAAREVTNAEYRRFKPGHRSGMVKGKTLDGNNQPVVMVSWEDAARYCNWLSRQEGLSPFYREEHGTMVPVTPATNGYRLPFEAEWSYAARAAGHKTPARYPWEGSFPPTAVSGNYGDESGRSILSLVIRNYNDGYPVTAPVASFPANKAGFYDLGGNVSEWCHDFYTPRPGTGRLDIDPTGPATGSHHVIRGSSWRDSTISELRLSYRSYGRQPKNDVGFRLARYAR